MHSADGWSTYLVDSYRMTSSQEGAEFYTCSIKDPLILVHIYCGSSLVKWAEFCTCSIKDPLVLVHIHCGSSLVQQEDEDIHFLRDLMASC